MINVQYNFTKQNEYPFYHICFYEEGRIIFEKFDLSVKEVFELIKEMNVSNFKVVGTLNNIELCLRYINEKENAGIIGCDLEKGDIFKSSNTIFVNCTDVFK